MKRSAIDRAIADLLAKREAIDAALEALRQASSSTAKPAKPRKVRTPKLPQEVA